MFFKNMETLPYTYVVTCIPTGLRYYGVRYKCGCHPSDLWVTYFTSSRIVLAAVEKYGKEKFSTEIRRTFEAVADARDWEYRVLRRLHVPLNQKWLNQTVNKAKPDGPMPLAVKLKISISNRGKKRSLDTCAKIGLSKRGNKHPLYGSIRSSETRAKISLSESGKTLAVETKLKLGLADSIECPHCHISGKRLAMRRWHFDRCQKLRGINGIACPGVSERRSDSSTFLAAK